MDKVSDFKSRLKGTKVMVIGDIMLDSYLFGKVNRISPEAPVPVVSVEKRANKLGGAANVALNIKELGAEPILCSVIGNDDKADVFFQILDDNKMCKDGIVKSETRRTTTKFRIIGNNTQMLRVDEEDDFPLKEAEIESLKSKIKSLISENDIKAIIFEDYDKGCINQNLIEFVVEIANEKGIIISADPKRNNFDFYKNITLFKPNLKELNEGLNIQLKSNDYKSIVSASREFVKKQNIKYLVVTLSENGVLLINGNSEMHLPTQVRNISDVSGAGDTVISVLSLMLAIGESPENSAKLANLAGGLVCESVGVVPIKLDFLMDKAFDLNLI
jgi:rfaE bifunctional protein kinase chain/domain